MGIVILSEDKITKPAFVIDNRQGIELMIPDDVICFFKACPVLCPDQTVKRSHEVAYRRVGRHAADAVITPRNNTDQFPVLGAVFCYCDGGVPGF